MTERAKTTGGPAYPIEAYLAGGYMQAEGMSIRFRTAIAAMQGILAADADSDFKPEHIAERAFAISDAMLQRAADTDPKIERDTNDDLPF
ncbi:hypothetical protein [Agrobacterium sp. ST15.13.015]|uniref:hypothetical protein n=1 Tax=Agrobacterium sp. ST15.13.015 TaxID=3017319 RepID=UPI0022C1799B|nr:hypothetical protein [Agrobacterium sp. ST15.13.015]MCZ7501997.1 hypothetical protein [Rhizobium rhizogenes]